jgi:shikimate kinase
MNAPGKILITGFMAAGKTTVAGALARRLGLPLVDLDEFIVARHGRSIAKIIDEEGEANFREAETAALVDVLAQGACVTALGGGAWTIERNRTLIAGHEGFTIWLDAPFDLCWQRIVSQGDLRPLAREREEARRRYDERRPAYGLADLRVEMNEGRDAEEIAEEIIKSLSSGKAPEYLL